MITGGAAVGFWGRIRTTMDIDMVIQMHAGQADGFLKAIEKEAYVEVQEAKKALQKRTMFNIIPNSTMFKVDIIPLDEGNTYEMEKFSRRVKMNFQGRDIYVISPEDLIISKLLWSKSEGGSERQIADCESIWKMNQEDIDKKYIQEWVEALGVKPEFKKLSV